MLIRVDDVNQPDRTCTRLNYQKIAIAEFAGRLLTNTGLSR